MHEPKSYSPPQLDWSKLPYPTSNESLDHLIGKEIPECELESTREGIVNLRSLEATSVLFIYPFTAPVGKEIPEDILKIPGAPGCVSQCCNFRDNFSELENLGVKHVLGLSSQDSDYQMGVAKAVNLQFPLLSDPQFMLADLLKLPTFDLLGMKVYKRITFIIKKRRIIKFFHPVFPPDVSAKVVITWLSQHVVRTFT